jgi:ABC-type lipoprotein export system ATPase subunit
LGKDYSLVGRDDAVSAIKGITLLRNSEFYPILNGEFVIIRGPSGFQFLNLGGGKTTFLNIIGTID